MTHPVEALQTALLAFIEEFTDAHEVTVAEVVGTLNVVAFEVMQQNAQPETERFNQDLN